MIADRRRGLVGASRGQRHLHPGLPLPGWCLGRVVATDAIVHRQSKRPVKWRSDALSKKRATTPTWIDCNGF